LSLDVLGNLVVHIKKGLHVQDIAG
jgi:hypothetical protein